MTAALLARMAEWMAAGRRFAMITLVDTVGSTPRKPGARMLVGEDMQLVGTIGGGCVEADAIMAAMECLRTGRPRLLHVDIKKKNADEIDMLCGGELTLFVEPIMPQFQLLICGGGHISRALAHVCEGLDFAVTIVDDRPQFANEGRFPSATATIACPYEELGRHVRLTDRTMAVVVTRGHSGDEVCLRTLVRSPACFITMVGSRSKWANLRANLLGAGYTAAELERVVCPAGLDIGSVTPEEIAISVAAQLIQRRAAARPVA